MSDNGSTYRSRDFCDLLAKGRHPHIRTRPYTPRTNGPSDKLRMRAERFIQTSLREWISAEPTSRPQPEPKPCRHGSTATTPRDPTQPSADKHHGRG